MWIAVVFIIILPILSVQEVADESSETAEAHHPFRFVYENVSAGCWNETVIMGKSKHRLKCLKHCWVFPPYLCNATESERKQIGEIWRNRSLTFGQKRNETEALIELLGGDIKAAYELWKAKVL